MRRSLQSEILDGGDVADHLVERAYRDLAKIHNILGDTAAVIAAIRRDPLPIRRILDIGCARGDVLREVQRQLGVEVIGIDLRAPRIPEGDLPIIRANAIRDPLPIADVAFSMSLSHHLSEADFIALIRNVGRSCRRFFILDLVRHRLPLTLFRIFVAPLVSRIAAADGQLSVQRSYTPAEWRKLLAEALAGSGASIHCSVHPLYIRQTVDVCYARSGGPRGRVVNCASAAAVSSNAAPKRPLK